MGLALSMTATAGFCEDDKAAPAKPPVKHAEAVCEITGTVSDVQRVERSPWTDNTPSTLSIFETQVKVSIINRRPHRAGATVDTPCLAAIEKNEIRTYKLCSSTRPKKGDRITGTEGGSTGSANVTRCIFDLKVKEKEEGVKN